MVLERTGTRFLARNWLGADATGNATNVANVAEAQTIIDGAELALRSDLATKTRNRGERTEIETQNTEYWQLNY